MANLEGKPVKPLQIIFLALAAFWRPLAHAEQATVVTACGAASLTPGTVVMSLQDVNGVACSGPGGQVRVVAACGSLAPFGPTPAGSQAYSTVDTTGKGCGLGFADPRLAPRRPPIWRARPARRRTPADLTTLICGLVTDGVWAKLDALYVLAQQTQADALLNLVGTSYSIVGGFWSTGPRRALRF